MGQPILSNCVADSLLFPVKLKTRIWLVVATYSHEVRPDDLKDSPLIDDEWLSGVHGGA